MINKRRFFLVVCMVAAMFFCFSQKRYPGWERTEFLSASQNRMIQKQLFRAAEICRDAQSVDDREAKLIEAGFAVMDTDAVYPAYLANAEKMQNFVRRESGSTAVLGVNRDGSFYHQFFIKGQEDIVVVTQIAADYTVTSQEILPLYETELTQWGTIYYRCYPADDPHYMDYSCFRLTPADRELYDLTRTYILPVGYRMVNLFLCDWQEGNWGSLSLNDVFEYLYEVQTGVAFPWQEYPIDTETGYVPIPAELFEDTVLPFFSISREELRDIARYDPKTDSYPWRAVHGDDLTAWELPFFQPEVTKCTGNPDGTLTLTVQVGCLDRKTNALLTHAVTVRPLEDGGFQYAGNAILDSDDGNQLPAFPRFQLDCR